MPKSAVTGSTIGGVDSAMLYRLSSKYQGDEQVVEKISRSSDITLRSTDAILEK